MRREARQAGFTFIELTLVVVILGVVAAVAIPAFMKYMQRPDVTEPAVQLGKVSRAALRVYESTSAFPIGTAATLPPAGCCGNPNNKCLPVAKATWAADPVWAALGFSIEEQTLFQYSYTGDAAQVTATAVGDLDCDGARETSTRVTFYGTRGRAAEHASRGYGRKLVAHALLT